MNIFNRASKFVLSREGVYSDDPDDPGGETVYGIARKYHPGWAGWMIVDRLREGPHYFPESLEDHPDIMPRVREFYRVNIWEKYRCHQLPGPVAFALFDSVFHCGPRAIRWLQAGILDQGEPIEVDGIIGPQTVAMAGECHPWRLAMDLLGARMKFYIRKRRSRRKYWDGWMIRVCELTSEAADTPIEKDQRAD